MTTVPTKLCITGAAAEQAAALAPLTWPSLRPLLEADSPAPRTLCLAAWAGDTPLALAVTAASPDQPESDGWRMLHSLTVAAQARRQGIGRRMLTALCDTLAGQGVARLHCRFSDRLPGAPAFQSLLEAGGWGPCVAERLRICGAVGDTALVFRDRGGLLRRLDQSGFRLTPWAEAAEAATALADREISAGRVPGWAHPAPWAHRLDADLSLVITTATGQPVGWVICEFQPALRRLYYPIGWVIPPHDGQGWLLGAYARGAMRAVDKYGAPTEAVIESGATQAGMWRVFDRHFRPHARWVDHLLAAERQV